MCYVGNNQDTNERDEETDRRWTLISNRRVNITEKRIITNITYFYIYNNKYITMATNELTIQYFFPPFGRFISKYKVLVYDGRNILCRYEYYWRYS